MKKIGIIGSGIVAQTLGTGFLNHGYEVQLSSRTPEKLSNWKQQNPSGKVGAFNEAAQFGDMLVLAVSGRSAEAALELTNKEHLQNKTIIDTTNPVSTDTPQNGVLQFFTNANSSLMEQLQHKFPQSNFVKAFNSVGSAFMVNPTFETKPTMFTCGNNDQAKQEVHEVLDKFGWEIEDMGTAEAARAIEPLSMLWCIPGFRKNQWTHAFKLLKK